MDALIEVLVKAGEQSPVALLMGAVVWIFVQYLRGRDAQAEERDKRILKYMATRDEALALTLRELGHDCHEVQRRAVESLDANTAAWGKAQETLTAASQVADRAARILERHTATLSK